MILGNKSKTKKEDRDLWATPWEIFRGVEALLGRKFDLDACASEHNRKVDKFITEEMNWLEYDFKPEQEGCLNIWVNPPYSDPEPFILRAIELCRKHPWFCCMLLPASTSESWFKLCVEHASTIWFITAEDKKRGGRISFIHNATGKPVSGNSKGSALIIFSGKTSAGPMTNYISREKLIAMGRCEHEQ